MVTPDAAHEADDIAMTVPYASAAAVAEDRVRWSVACLAQLLDEARREGWATASGACLAGARPETLHATIAERVAYTPCDVTVVPLEWLRLRLELEPHELDALWLLVCVDLDPAVARLAGSLAVTDCLDVSVQLLARLVPLSSESLDRLVELGLVEGDMRAPRYRRPIRASERVTELALGELRLDPVVARVAKLELATAEPAASVVDRGAIVVAVGVEGSGRATRLRQIAARYGRGTLEIAIRSLASDGDELRRQLRAARREARLFDVVPLLRGLGARDERSDVLERELIAPHPGIVLATATALPAWFTARATIIEAVPPPDTRGRAQIWATALGDVDPGVIDAVAGRYAITPGAIVAAARNVRARSLTAINADDVHEGLRAHLGQQLGPLAKRIAWNQSWRDLVLAEGQRDQIDELIARVRHRRQVVEEQGFGHKTAKGHGTVALLSGPPGTGKTMVAALVAAELGLDLYQVDLSQLVSKYIGETEKGLATLFDVAEAGHVVLLFDEADALFAKRSEVKSSNDRYANLETNYLLQRLEAFGGISILTTNHETSLDDAFRRRLAVHVRFPMPDETERARLWRASIPDGAPLEGEILLGRLARAFDMSGGNIKNAVLRAAYRAASESVPISMRHFEEAAKAELEALGRL